MSLLVRGAIQTGVSAFILMLMLRFAPSGDIAATAQEVAPLRPLAVMMVIVFGLSIVLGLFRVVIGALDLVPREEVTGTVVDVRDRRMGDFLPRMAQRMIFERNPQGLDQRRWRTEVVLDTPSGIRQWTLRDRALEPVLQPGAQVRLRVTPLAGHVASAERAGAQPDQWA